MINTLYISASEAAAITGVTTQTIRNLCKTGTLTYKMRGNLFYPKREDVERYAEEIAIVHQVSKDMEEYKSQYVKQEAELKAQMTQTLEEYRMRMINMNMFPKRMEAIVELLKAVLDGLRRYVDFEDFNLSPRELNVMWQMLQGKSRREIGMGLNLSHDRVRQIWQKALRKMVWAKGTFERLQEENEHLKQTLFEKNKEIAILKGEAKADFIVTSETSRISRILAISVDDLDLSYRSRNCLRHGHNVKNLRDVCRLHRSDLLRTRNFGKKSLTEINELLDHYGLSFGMDVDKYPEYVGPVTKE